MLFTSTLPAHLHSEHFQTPHFVRKMQGLCPAQGVGDGWDPHKTWDSKWPSSLDWGQAECHLWGWGNGVSSWKTASKPLCWIWAQPTLEWSRFPCSMMRAACFICNGFSFPLRAADKPAVGTSGMGSHSSGSDMQEAR